MKSKLKFSSHRFLMPTVLHILFISLLTLIIIFYPSNYKFPDDKKSILTPNYHVENTYQELSDHNDKIFSSLESRESLGYNSILSQIDGIRQTRSIYIGIIATILTIIFSINKNINRNIFFIPLILIIIFYGLDIHLTDMVNRSLYFNHKNSVALDHLINQKPVENIWYNIDYDNRKSEFDDFRKNRLVRKLNSAINPNLPQKIFYILPFIYLVYYLRTLNYHKILDG